MRIIGIIAEYNPFHTGHAYQISRTRTALDGDCAVVCVMSGNWTQQADCAISDKWTRARLALMGGADLVLELPTPWATASAERFARGGVSLLNAAGVVDVLSFGSECGDVEKLKLAARCLDSSDYPALLQSLLTRGKPFAACRQQAVETLAGKEIGELLRSPNNNLGVEYIRSLNALGSSIRPTTVPRTGSAHGEKLLFLRSDPLSDEDARRVFWAENPVLSATGIRQHLMDGEWDLMEPYLPAGGRELLEGNTIGLSSLAHAERAMLARIRAMTAENWAALPDSGAAEGLPRRLEQAGREAASVAEFFSLAATKRYTYARLQRLVLWAFLGLTAAQFPALPPYLRVLGSTEKGREVLKVMKEKAALPIITKPSHARELDPDVRALFEQEARCTDLYDLCLPRIPKPGREWTTSPILL